MQCLNLLTFGTRKSLLEAESPQVENHWSDGLDKYINDGYSSKMIIVQEAVNAGLCTELEGI